MVNPKPKKAFLVTVKCPCCDCDINVFKITEIIEPAVPAEKEEYLEVEHLKNTQVTLPLEGAAHKAVPGVATPNKISL